MLHLLSHLEIQRSLIVFRLEVKFRHGPGSSREALTPRVLQFDLLAVAGASAGVVGTISLVRNTSSTDIAHQRQFLGLGGGVLRNSPEHAVRVSGVESFRVAVHDFGDKIFIGLANVVDLN
jgi:hypothetical protein